MLLYINTHKPKCMYAQRSSSYEIVFRLNVCTEYRNAIYFDVKVANQFEWMKLRSFSAFLAKNFLNERKRNKWQRWTASTDRIRTVLCVHRNTNISDTIQKRKKYKYFRCSDDLKSLLFINYFFQFTQFWFCSAHSSWRDHALHSAIYMAHTIRTLYKHITYTNGTQPKIEDEFLLFLEIRSSPRSLKIVKCQSIPKYIIRLAFIHIHRANTAAIFISFGFVQ